MLEQLFDCLDHGREPPTGALWARESVLVGIGAEKSAAEGRTINLDELRRSSAFPEASPYQDLDQRSRSGNAVPHDQL
jgi:hypothetical protein